MVSRGGAGRVVLASVIACALSAACTVARDLDYLSGGATDAGLSTEAGAPVDATPGACDPSKLTEDTHHCGRCGHDCLGGACRGGACEPVVLASGFTEPFGIAVAGSVLLVGHASGIDRMSLDGEGRERFAEINGVAQLATDGTSVYFGERKNSRILRASLADKSVVELAQSVEAMQGIAVAPDLLFFSRDGAKLVERAPLLVPLGPAEILMQDLVPAGIDVADGTLYVAGGGNVVPLANDGKDVQPPVLQGNDPFGVKVDGNDLLVSLRGTGTLVRVSRTGGPVDVLAKDLANPGQIATTPTAIYVTEVSAGTVKRLAR